MDQLHTANKVCGGCCAISLNTVDTESSVSPMLGSETASICLADDFKVVIEQIQNISTAHKNTRFSQDLLT